MATTTHPVDALDELRAEVLRMKRQPQAYSRATIDLVDDAADVIEDLLKRIDTLERRSPAARTLFIPDDAWEPTGPDEDPATRLSTRITIASPCGALTMHLEAHAVTREGEHDEQVGTGYRDTVDALFSMAEPDGAFQTTEFSPGGPRYVLVAFPHS